MKNRKILLNIILVLLVVIFLCSSYMVISTYLSKKQETQQFDVLIEKNNINNIETKETLVDKVRVMNKDNSDLIGWVSIDGTNINYPIMYTPDEYDYYLHRNLDKDYSYSGVPFVDGNILDKRDDNPYLYGHSMLNGTMFRDLNNYHKEQYFIDHPIINIDTVIRSEKYAIIAAFDAYILPEESKDFKFYHYMNFNGEFVSWKKEILNRSIYNCGQTFDENDDFITLVTCNDDTKDGRMVVVGKRIKE
ncbi:MAG: class B sortase [Erysipelotrichaceae bacterium]